MVVFFRYQITVKNYIMAARMQAVARPFFLFNKKSYLFIMIGGLINC